VPPRLDVAGLDGVAFKIAGKTHTVAAPWDAV
jgi:hypothetical protein